MQPLPWRSATDQSTGRRGTTPFLTYSLTKGIEEVLVSNRGNSVENSTNQCTNFSDVGWKTLYGPGKGPSKAGPAYV